ncbi:hypothetical protein FB567DRAFT_551421 [Paraphoma chrysanthemicola]|uniref:Uncharacterized protein n=1 Tax=Paraphoma chrysanthemicola TaxID=798071 RepID=A0A8K0VWE9_9PLEO|nr:hypothetical protein FB567DRAFT_551421 [Paraphoma chrysanthemicola]
MASNSKPYHYTKHWIGQPRPVRIVVVGAGVSGIAAVKLYKEILGNLPVSLTLYDKNHDVGGTWLENRYPGCSCDIPAHNYTYSWEGNPNWSRMYVEAEEIFDYYKDRAQTYGVFEYVKLEHKVHEAVWNDAKGKWVLRVEDLATGQMIEDEAEVLINAGGFVNTWKWPDVSGLESFRGKLLHSAAWDNTVSFENKTVAVIGSGSSAIQIVPRIQKDVKHLFSINRSPTWITPQYVVEHAPRNPGMRYTPEQQKKWAEDPEEFLRHRKEIDAAITHGFRVNYRNSALQAEAYKASSQEMHAILSKKEGLSELLIPKFEVGCRRLTPGVGYLEALVEENVTVIGEGIEKFTADSIVTQSGKDIKVDAVICATGFDTSYRPPFNVRGKHGKELRDVWADKPKSYLAVAVSGFPNYFTAIGPNFPVANGSLPYAVEAVIRYAFEAVRKIQRHNIKSLHPTPEAVEDFQQYKDSFMQDTVWTSDCRSWYKNGKPDGEVWGPWPGSALHFRQSLDEPRWEDYEIEYWHSNRFEFLGDGSTEQEVSGGDTSYYLREPGGKVRGDTIRARL